MATVLIVDDEQSIRASLARFLEKDGHRVLTAGDVDEALLLMGRETVDVVVSDIILPRVSGIELLARLRDEAPSVQVIMMTGDPAADTAAAAVRAGAFDYLFKPVDKDQVLRTVAAAARMKAVEEERTRLSEENARYQHRLEQLVEERTAELLETERQLGQAQKMDAVGKLAGGVAHDFNNMLTVILGCADLALEDVRPESSVREDLEQVLDAGRKAQAMTRQLLAFSRNEISVPKHIDLGRTVRGIGKMLGRLLGEDVTLRFQSPGDGVVVNADPGQIEQVVMNLAINARDAMPNGGELKIDVDRVHLVDASSLRATDPAEFEPGEYAVIAVTDTGFGIPADIQPRVFEPFFTTKEAGRGTGLGLSTVFGIVRQNFGFISLVSDEGRGSTFRVYLPGVAGQVVDETHSGTPDAMLRGNHTVLVVEDEERVRRVTGRMVRAMGYTVLEAANGAEAMGVARASRVPIDLLLSDVVMPGMSVHDMAEGVARICPGVRCLYVSGYSTEDSAGMEGRMTGRRLIHKPFTKRELARHISRALSA